MKLVYVGPHDAVEVPLPFGGTATVRNGETAKLPDSLAKSLLEQPGNWAKPKEGVKHGDR